MLSIKNLGELAIAEEAKEASTGGSTETGNDSKPVDELKEACMALVKIYNAGVASGRFTKKGQQAQRYATPAQLGPAPAPGVFPSSEQCSPAGSGSGSPQAVISPPPAVSGKNVRDAGVLCMQSRKRQNEQSGGEEGAHRYPKKGGMGALNELALNFGAYLGQLTDVKADGKENSLKDNIEALKELTALRAQAESDREKKLYTKKINKILAAMDSGSESD